ncbi:MULTISPECIES: 1,2-phenylacetyl-CoA epoxidase subunit PaaB [Streptomyces]|uniref:1,2-phenylacetyl-CoA epoxidase subunit B n=2 Tax=Streptomyces TaxID=1883 RepID=A0AAU2HA53_9ACTN|nr:MULTISPECIES: 1,2-phenylacetyl-CoA epoxidase subunit PaaB [Streptomyces]PKV83808.1 ring-1,2-phenylacetyl-CoA epoxidase subunit PaaB [Streptomyces sp. TLI_146]WHM40346.1 1,2-phenylacetyl-CoA epoxidase subunit B [Streptomyces sp. BPTC-684]GGP45056.1 phenylacetate-CoA oxygenase subunit PaaB [Streptomyces melanogenes]
MSERSARVLTPWEVFIRPRRGLAHQHVGSVHGADADMALANARDLYTRRGETVSVWVVRSDSVHAASPSEKDPFFSNAAHKPYRYPEHYIPLNEESGHDG